MPDVDAYTMVPARAAAFSQSATRRDEAAPIPRTYGLLIAFGASLALWAMLIEAGVQAYAYFVRF